MISKNYFFYLTNIGFIKYILILKALKEIKKYNKELLVISSGIFYDYRHPNHARSIKKFICDNDLRLITKYWELFRSKI